MREVAHVRAVAETRAIGAAAPASIKLPPPVIHQPVRPAVVTTTPTIHPQTTVTPPTPPHPTTPTTGPITPAPHPSTVTPSTGPATGPVTHPSGPTKTGPGTFTPETRPADAAAEGRADADGADVGSRCWSDAASVVAADAGRPELAGADGACECDAWRP